MQSYDSFKVSFKGISISDDNYIFLNCIEGAEIIFELHDEIYEKILPNHFKKEIELVKNHIKYIPEEIFSANLVDEFNCLMEKFDVKFLHNVATDGISNHLAEYVNKLTDEEYDIWVKYHLSTAERKDLLGHSSHILYICTKN